MTPDNAIATEIQHRRLIDRVADSLASENAWVVNLKHKEFPESRAKGYKASIECALVYLQFYGSELKSRFEDAEAYLERMARFGTIYDVDSEHVFCDRGSVELVFKKRIWMPGYSIMLDYIGYSESKFRNCQTLDNPTTVVVAGKRHPLE